MDRIQKLLEAIDRWADFTIKIRRQIHENPELSYKEFETSALIANELTRLGIPYVESPVKPGLIATIDSGKPGKLLVLRGDMDALPVQEETDLPFKSKNDGIMHACGHDVHTSNLLTVGGILNEMKEEWTGRVRLVFQPAEEHGGGGREMIKAGLFDEMPDCCLGVHVWPDKRGKITLGRGYRTAYSDGCTITVHGKAAHSSKPQEGVDAVLIAANIILALNTITSRNLDPKDAANLNVGTIKGGTAPNILADEAVMLCMMRNVNPDSREVMFQRVEEICKGTAKAMGGSCDTDFIRSYPSVYNNPEVADFLYDTFRKHKDALFQGLDEAPPDYLEEAPEQMLAAEDFGYYGQRVPSCFLFIGTGEYAPAHNQKFQVDEQYIKFCTRVMALAALEYMNR